MSSGRQHIIKKTKIPSLKIGQKRFKAWLHRKTGYDALQNPVLMINAQWFDQNIHRIDTPTTFISWLQHQDDFFFTRNDIQASENLHLFLSAQARITVIQKAHSAVAEVSDLADGKSVWYHNPTTNEQWPREHIYTYPKTPEIESQLKQTSYKGRFTHIPNVMRAWHLTHDRCLIDQLIIQIENFEKESPIYQGPQWSNISDIAMRNSMFCLAYSHLYKSEFATPHTILLLTRQIAACTLYLMKHVDNFDYKLNTSAFMAVASAVYYAAATLPWLKISNNWHKTSHRWLFQGIENQFLPDGGYASGSLTEQKAALHALSWVYAIANKRHDTLLAQRISNICDKSFTLLQHVSDRNTGAFPEIGHHQFDDFPSLSTCDKNDMRPLLACIGYIAHGHRQFKAGPWDESLYWLFGLQASRQKCYPPALSPLRVFPYAGLSSAQMPHSTLIFRSGSLQHYKHQHADQMHVDYWHYGKNILVDSGSATAFTTLDDKYFNEASAHNGLTINNQSLFTTDDYGHISHIPTIDNVTAAAVPNIMGQFIATHDSFNFIEKGLHHKRCCLIIRDGLCIVIDQLRRPEKTKGRMQKLDIKLHWLMARLAYQDNGHCIILSHEDMPNFGIKWHCTAPYTSVFYPASSRGQARAWQNSDQNKKAPIHKLQIKTTSQQSKVYAVTCFGKADLLPKYIDFDVDKYMLTCDKDAYPLKDIFSN